MTQKFYDNIYYIIRRWNCCKNRPIFACNTIFLIILFGDEVSFQLNNVSVISIVLLFRELKENPLAFMRRFETENDINGQLIQTGKLYDRLLYALQIQLFQPIAFCHSLLLTVLWLTVISKIVLIHVFLQTPCSISMACGKQAKMQEDK